MGQYAADTSVSADASRSEIERTLQRYGADSFMYGWDENRALVMFRMQERHIRFVLEMPDRQADEFWVTPARRTRRSPDQAQKAWEQATRQKWRALALVIKAKLEAVESGITEFEDEFGMHTILPDGSVVRDHVRPAIVQAYETGTMPTSLLALPSGA